MCSIRLIDEVRPLIRLGETFVVNVVMLKKKTFCKAANDRALPRKRPFVS